MNSHRKELKFIVSDTTLLDVRNRINGIMTYDRHQNGDHYRIRSVYFDSHDYRCYRENLAGVSPREKYRIRTYDCNANVIFAEIKTNYRNTVSKLHTNISHDTFDILTSGDPQSAMVLSEKIRQMETDGDQIGKRVLEKYMNALLAGNMLPVCIVDYARCAYVYPIGNVRITFDRNITASKDLARMFDPSLTGRCALFDNKHILEIKYDEFLPDEIRSLLSGAGLSRTSCSKYVLSIEALS